MRNHLVVLRNSQIGRLRRPFARPSGMGGIKVVGFIKMHWDRLTYRTDAHVGQTHMWDRRTCGTDAHMGQTHIGQFEKHLC